MTVSDSQPVQLCAVPVSQRITPPQGQESSRARTSNYAVVYELVWKRELDELDRPLPDGQITELHVILRDGRPYRQLLRPDFARGRIDIKTEASYRSLWERISGTRRAYTEHRRLDAIPVQSLVS